MNEKLDFSDRFENIDEIICKEAKDDKEGI